MKIHRGRNNILPNKIRSFYKWIFYLFKLSFIFTNSKNRRHKNSFHSLCNICNISGNFLIYVFQFAISISYLYMLREFYGKQIPVYICMYAAFSFFRFYIRCRISELHGFTTMLSRLSYNLQLCPPVKPCILFYSCILILLNAYIFFYLLILYLKQNLTYLFTFGWTINNGTLKFIASFTNVFSSTIFFYMPINMFAIYYVTICCHIKDIILAFEKLMKTSTKLNFGELNDVYSRIKRVVNLIDTKVGELIFISFSFNAITLYFGLIELLHAEYKESPGKIFSIAIFFSCVTSLLTFMAQTLAADSVYKASLVIKARLQNLKVGESILQSSYFRFHQNCSEEISLTIWGILSIKRNVIFGIMGTILTYSLLFDNIITQSRGV